MNLIQLCLTPSAHPIQEFLQILWTLSGFFRVILTSTTDISWLPQKNKINYRYIGEEWWLRLCQAVPLKGVSIASWGGGRNFTWVPRLKRVVEKERDSSNIQNYFLGFILHANHLVILVVLKWLLKFTLDMFKIIDKRIQELILNHELKFFIRALVVEAPLQLNEFPLFLLIELT